MNGEAALTRPTGRPQHTSNVRAALIMQARTLFINHSYEKVSTRMIASAAGVNMGMIRYYFNHKAGLFEAMIRETLSPMHVALAGQDFEKGGNFMLAMMTNFYNVMAKHKNFPRFINRTMQLPPNKVERQITEKVLLENLPLFREKSHAELSKDHVLKADVKAQFAHFTMLSLALFPFVAPPEILELHGINVDENFLFELLQHNSTLLKQGIINEDNE